MHSSWQIAGEPKQKTETMFSAIIPLFNGAGTLERCLEALFRSTHRPEEVIVVDDGSTDGSASLAERFGVTVLSTGGRCGPARARNLGARHASGNILVFVDADVCLHPDALAGFAARFADDPAVDAVIGAYDDNPGDPGFISQYKNLMHAFVHQQGRARAFSFWCGCGAVKRSVYLAHGGLDESYHRASIEDIEFGFRMMRAGRKLVLDATIRCQHLKAWTLGRLLYTEIFLRGVPWTELILRTRYLPNDLNLRWGQRASVALAGLLSAAALGTGWQWRSGAPLAPGFGIAAMTLALGLLLILNREFYRFLAEKRGWWFTAKAAPVHLLYFWYCGLSFAMGCALHATRHLFPRTPPDPILLGQGEDVR